MSLSEPTKEDFGHWCILRKGIEGTHLLVDGFEIRNVKRFEYCSVAGELSTLIIEVFPKTLNILDQPKIINKGNTAP